MRPCPALGEIVALLALAVAVPAAAQGSVVHLSVVVRHDHEPVRDASVRADTVVALTDAQGRASSPRAPLRAVSGAQESSANVQR